MEEHLSAITSLATALGAIDQKGLGTEVRSQEEIVSRGKFETNLALLQDKLPSD